MTTPERAAEEIKAILQNYDLAAMIVLQGPEELTFVNAISPSWSCARLNEETGELRIRAKREEFASREEQKRCVEATPGGAECGELQDGGGAVEPLVCDLAFRTVEG